jgi:hypothetical protein
MASWGTGSFENDDAQKLLQDLHSKEPGYLKAVLERAAEGDYLPAPESGEVVAAAEVVAVAKGNPPQSVPPEIAEWISNIDGAPSVEMTELARTAVCKIRLNSELKDLWLEAEGLNEWSAALRDLEERLIS